MTPRYPGADLAEYRDQTARQAQMPGVTRPSFRCALCSRTAVMKGCKRTAAGTICAACHQAREYRKTTREAKQ